jgi:methylated-DNA-[protein]-cysteine S-methyltransferase
MTTTFAQNVYAIVSRIPRGLVMTYGEVARAAGKPRAARAVGTLMAKNPYPKTEVPCHRVVRSDGVIGNYSGPGGRQQKEKLLRLEGISIKSGKVVS